MNPLTQKWIGTLIRSALLVVLAKFGGDWSEMDVDSFVSALMALGVVVWGMYEKWSSQRKQTTTLAVMNRLAGSGVPDIQQRDIEAVIQKGDHAPASTPKDKAPVLDGPGDGMARLQSATARF